MRSTFHSPRRRVIAAALMVLVCSAAGVAAMAQSASATVTTLKTFTTPGTYTWTVPTISHFATGGSFPGGTNQGDGKVIITTTS